ncbi:MAG: monovalent cation:proton antiporter-2 (CPA2) family protein [Pseudomonadota bacterium]
MLVSALIYLLAAVIAVPIAKKLGLGSVLGYLIAGIVIGPSLLGLVGNQTDVMHFAEFGVVIMLFIIGLELEPSRLWSMRRQIMGLGGLQVVATAAIFAAILYFGLQLAWQLALAIGLTVALSSTAIVIQSLTERGQMNTQAGNNAFSVLLFQDIAVIPILALLPLLATFPQVAHVDGHSVNLIEGLPVWQQAMVTLGAVVAIVLAGRFFSSPIFRVIANTKLPELFTAVALLIVVAISVAMTSIGLSAALGTFIAGVVLADSEFRHEIEADIEPFKGLLLGLFLVKAGVLLFLGWLFQMDKRASLLFTVALAQGGEFAFVLTSAGKQSGVFDEATSSMVIIVVALSMLLAPLLFVVYEAWFSRVGQNASYEDDQEITATDSVIIAGYGRFGQVVGRMLRSNGYNLTILDHSPAQIELVRRFGNTVFYGEASRPDLLEAAGANDAKLLVVGVDSAEMSMDIIRTAQKHFPHLKIVARAVDRRHAYDIINSDVAAFRRETFDSAIYLGKQALIELGLSPERAERVGDLFEEYDEQSLRELAALWGDDKSYGVAVSQRVEDLKNVLAKDAEEQDKLEAAQAAEVK